MGDTFENFIFYSFVRNILENFRFRGSKMWAQHHNYQNKIADNPHICMFFVGIYVDKDISYQSKVTELFRKNALQSLVFVSYVRPCKY